MAHQVEPTDIELVNRAMSVALKAHAGQVDKQGVPYAAHVMAVAVALLRQRQAPWVVAAGVLHDVVEDTELTDHDLLDMGFPESTVRIVEALTRPPDVSYDEFISRVIAAGPEAMAVKLADVEDNLGRIEGLQPEGQSLRERYSRARSRLSSARDVP